MNDICPYFKTSEEKHTIKMRFALEHMLSCQNRIKACSVPQCGFVGNECELNAHYEEEVVRHTGLWEREHRELLAVVHTTPEEAVKDYVKEIGTSWSKSWTIEDFHLIASRASSRNIPLMSENFKKGSQVWRMIFFTDDSEIFLQLVSSPQAPQSVKATLAVKECAFSFPHVFLKEKEMVGGKLEGCSKYRGDVEVKAVVTLFEYRKKAKNIFAQVTNQNQSGEVSTGLDTRSIVNNFVDKLERQGKIDEILAKAEKIARKLPKQIGRGGKVGADALKSLDVSIRKVFEARIRAPQALGDEVDDIVSSRYLTPNMNSQIDQLYTGRDSSNDTGLNLHVMGNKSSYISGSIIILLKDA